MRSRNLGLLSDVLGGSNFEVAVAVNGARALQLAKEGSPDLMRTEEARAALQEEVIRAQDARLAELSTPLIPITDRIMVMPLIGTIDAVRAQRALEVALNGVQANRAAVVIIDVRPAHDHGVCRLEVRYARAEGF